MHSISAIKAREVFNSRGIPALEVDVFTRDGYLGRAIAPSGASKGSLEAMELVDGDPDRLFGKGLLKAITFVEQEVCPGLNGLSVLEQEVIDRRLSEIDGTQNKSRIGANVTTAVSLAVAKVSAKIQNKKLYEVFHSLITDGAPFIYYPPIPMLNVINGGLHADNALSIQEFMICPVGYETFRQKITKAAEVFHKIKQTLKQSGRSTNVGDEGGFAPEFEDAYSVLQLLTEAIGSDSGEMKIALDVAASTFHRGDSYFMDSRELSTDELIQFYADCSSRYNVFSIEDPISEEDWSAWKKITDQLGSKVQIVGDDVFVTNPTVFSKGISNGIANAILIKVNQIGTVSEAVESIKIARQNGYNVIISHRSGETEDTSISHLAVACGPNTFLKAGSMSRSERVAKYNEVLRIEEGLN